MAGPDIAGRIRAGEAEALRDVTTGLIGIRADNLIARPWGGRALFDWKHLPELHAPGPFGEVFEVSGDRRDPESAAHPSVVLLRDGSDLLLPELLEIAGTEILGAGVFERHGPNLPLLPKTLDVRELLSVQAHPPGNPEAYYILQADEGATLRIGFVRELDAGTLGAVFRAGREAQESFLEVLGGGVSTDGLQSVLSAAFAQGEGVDALLGHVRACVESAAPDEELRALLSALAGAWHQTLGLLTEVPARVGTMIFNATPVQEGRPRSAEVHALGNPEGREVVLLEVRCPAPTYRAWDHVRFPMREIDIDRAMDVLDFGCRTPDSFMVEEEPIEGRPGATRSACCEAFVVEHLRPTAEAPVAVPEDPAVRTLHAVSGTVALRRPSGEMLGRLRRGESAVAPASLGAFRVERVTGDAEVICVRIPEEGRS